MRKLKQFCIRGHEYTDENTYWYFRDIKGKPFRARSCRTCVNENGRKYNNKNREEVNKRNRERYDIEKMRDQRLKRTYNLSQADYEKMLKNQNYECKICGRSSRRFNIDHCHASGIVRGILCSNCNWGLGYFNDNTESLKNAILYLEQFKENQC